MNDEGVGLFSRLETVRTSTQAGSIRRDIVSWGESPVVRAWEYHQHYGNRLTPAEVNDLLADAEYSKAQAAIYEEMMRHLRDELTRLLLGSKPCRGCHYSDRQGKYCGLGREMVKGCAHKLIEYPLTVGWYD